MTFSRIVGVIGAVAALSGCVSQQRYRFIANQPECFSRDLAAGQDPMPGTGPGAGKFPSLDCGHSFFKAGVIEFDEDGKALDPAQLQKVLKLIEFEKGRAPGGKVITLLYVHGWKNNADEVAPGEKAKDVEKFKSAMTELGYRSREAAPDSPVPVIGVYMGWRGKSMMGPDWFTFVSYWPRRNTANRVGGGPNFAESVNAVIDTSNGTAAADLSRVILVGHSFGARVLEHAVETDKIKLYEEPPKAEGRVNPRVDLVLYVNSANDARLSMRRIDLLQKSGLTVRRSDFDPNACQLDPKQPACGEYPLLVAITSRGDSATKRLLPVANSLNQDKGVKDPPVPSTDHEYLDEIPSVGKFKKVAAAHFPFLQSHVVDEVSCPATGQPVCAAGDQKCFAFRGRGDCPACYKASLRPSRTVEGKPAPVTAFNQTPYWIMDIDPRIVKDHGDIWNLNFVEMLGALIGPRGFFDPGSGRMTLQTR